MQRLKIAVMLGLVLCLLLTIGVQAMSSENYQLNWLVPLSGGGGSASSAHYSMDITIGQSVIGPAGSENYDVQLGFWQKTAITWALFLPAITK